MIRFLTGAIAGGLIVWMWGDRMRRMAERTATQARASAVDGIDAVQAKAEGVIDAAKEQIRSGLQASRDYLRPVDQEHPQSVNAYR